MKYSIGGIVVFILWLLWMLYWYSDDITSSSQEGGVIQRDAWLTDLWLCDVVMLQ